MPTARSKESKLKNGNTSVEHRETFIGPIPDPISLQKYEEINPGFAERLISMAEKEQEARLKSTDKIIDNDRLHIRGMRRGQFFALISLTLILAFCCFTIYYGVGQYGRDVAVAVTVGVVVAFFFRVIKKGNKEESAKGKKG